MIVGGLFILGGLTGLLIASDAWKHFVEWSGGSPPSGQHFLVFSLACLGILGVVVLAVVGFMVLVPFYAARLDELIQKHRVVHEPPPASTRTTPPGRIGPPLPENIGFGGPGPVPPIP